MVITSRAPLRVDFAGAWTDVNFFARGAGGAVINATIDKYVEGRLEILDANNADISPTGGISVSYHCEMPSGSGLGTSAALNVCWLSLVEAQIHPSQEYREQIAELAYQLEEILGVLGGKQDQYAAALGGFQYLTFNESVCAEKLNIQPAMVQELEKRLVLCYTGKSRLSGDIHENVWGAFRHGAPETVNALYYLRNCAIRMKTVIEEGNIEEFGELIGQSWKHQKALDASVSNDEIEVLFDIARKAGAMFGKATGAGGGGCLLFFTENDKQCAVTEALSSAGVRVIPFKFEFKGLQVNGEGSHN